MWINLHSMCVSCTNFLNGKFSYWQCEACITASASAGTTAFARDFIPPSRNVQLVVSRLVSVLLRSFSRVVSIFALSLPRISDLYASESYFDWFPVLASYEARWNFIVYILHWRAHVSRMPKRKHQALIDSDSSGSASESGSDLDNVNSLAFM